MYKGAFKLPGVRVAGGIIECLAITKKVQITKPSTSWADAVNVAL